MRNLACSPTPRTQGVPPRNVGVVDIDDEARDA